METEENFSLMVRVPKDLMVEPLAATRLEEEGAFISSAEAGNTDKSAPVSTRKARPESLSSTDNDPTLEPMSMEEIWGDEEVPGASSSRRGRFPPAAL